MSIDRTFNEMKTRKQSAGSIGFAIYPEDGMDTNASLRDADTARYKTNDMGKNCFQFFASE